MKNLYFILWIVLSLFPVFTFAQVKIDTEFFPESSFRDADGNTNGSGNLWKMSGNCTFPLFVKHNDKGQLYAWTATLNCSYALLENKGLASKINQEKMLNCSFNISHLRPLSHKWSLISSLGGGIYSAPNEITLNSVLANGAVLFIYKLRKNMEIGIGAGLTNSYGIPMVMPMICFNWISSGKVEIKVDMSNAMKASVATRIGKKIKLELTAIEMNGMASVVQVNGKSKIYSSAMLGSYLCPEYHINEKTALYICAGGNWLREIKLTDRSFRGFLDSFKENNKNEWRFNPSGYLAAGLKYGF
ncbi:hypothetical protein IMSAGC004_01952 [Bacteroidaceae bacterium]|uniref:DUF6268 family outer membrane beta-barrel protein n=1 Tax=uncultured Phocaeicola sp. TaxID=990718 RepID=UPI000E8E10BC|nr:DUF6268 family outer membrane beta-barrel protein [uncultured Phocaeicola sp.]GFH99548.1 hypothetical protein IMSAGC004_01952 [Bacteroidaceae bacterium]HBV84280.1 hypothetical protein [Lachnospiraceae bacterium]